MSPTDDAVREPRPGRARRPGTPRWVKVFGTVAAVLVLLFVVLHVLGHGFGGHASMHHHP